MLSIILVASIAVAVVLGYKTKINTGFFCIAFAYLDVSVWGSRQKS